MNHPENMPNSKYTQRPISEADIVKQAYELAAMDNYLPLVIGSLALPGLVTPQEKKIVATPEDVKTIGDLFTGGYTASSRSAMDSDILNGDIRSEDTSE